jgi:hypothetical protein
MKGLQEQNLLDVAVSTDSDLIALRIKRTISSLVTDKQVTVRDYKKLTTEVLPKIFGVEHDIVYGDLAFLCNMLENECIKVNTDIGKSECQMATQIDSDVAYLKRRNIRWQRSNRSVQDGTFPVSMLSFYCEDTVGNYNDDDINSLSHYMEYNDNYDDE